eukprot:SAG11_NODE_2301_length_3548_cov_5.628298_2_plen_87_part_00
MSDLLAAGGVPIYRSLRASRDRCVFVQDLAERALAGPQEATQMLMDGLRTRSVAMNQKAFCFHFVPSYSSLFPRQTIEPGTRHRGN